MDLKWAEEIQKDHSGQFTRGRKVGIYNSKPSGLYLLVYFYIMTSLPSSQLQVKSSDKQAKQKGCWHIVRDSSSLYGNYPAFNSLTTAPPIPQPPEQVLNSNTQCGSLAAIDSAICSLNESVINSAGLSGVYSHLWP